LSEQTWPRPVLNPNGVRGVFATWDDFCYADIRRHFSPEADYGVHWHDGDERWPEWRVSYIRDTGEVYAVCTGRGLGPVWLLGVVPADPVTNPDRETYYRTLDKILGGWADWEVSGMRLQWIIGRLAAHRREG
jgi:hypothetical protein